MNPTMSRLLTWGAVVALAGSACRSVPAKQPTAPGPTPTPVATPAPVQPVTPIGGAAPALPPVSQPPAAAQNPTGQDVPVADKLDPALNELVALTTSKAMSVGAWAEKNFAQTTPAGIDVDVRCTSEADVATVAAAVVKANGKVMSSVRNLLYATVPAEAVAEIAALQQVWTMSVSRALVKPAK